MTTVAERPVRRSVYNDRNWLARRQREVLRFMVWFYRMHGRMPSLAESLAGVGSSSRNFYYQTVSRLIDKGYLREVPNTSPRILEIPGLARSVRISDDEEGRRLREALLP